MKQTVEVERSVLSYALDALYAGSYSGPKDCRMQEKAIRQLEKALSAPEAEGGRA